MKRKYLPLGILALALCAVVIGAGEAHAANEDFVSTLVREFYNKTSNWEPTLKRYALGIFRWLVILEVCFLGIKAALNRDQLTDIFKQFVMLLLMAGFFMAVINYYQEWAWNLINGLGAIGKELTPGGYSSESPFLTGMQLVKLVLDKLSVWSPGNSIALLIAALVIIVCFALISAQVVFIKCEAMVAMAAALLLVAFGGSSFLKDYAVNAIRYVLAVAFNLFVMQLVLGVGIAFIEGFSTSTAELQDIFVVIGASVVLLALVKSLPDVCAGIINGSHVSSGAALTASAAAVVHLQWLTMAKNPTPWNHDADLYFLECINFCFFIQLLQERDLGICTEYSNRSNVCFRNSFSNGNNTVIFDFSNRSRKSCTDRYQFMYAF